MVDGETYWQTADGDYWHESAFTDDDAEPEPADETPPAWAQPLLEAHQADRDAELRAEGRAEAAAEIDADEAPLVEWLSERPICSTTGTAFSGSSTPRQTATWSKRKRSGKPARTSWPRPGSKESIQQPRDLDDALSRYFDERRQAKRAEVITEPAAEAKSSTFRQDPPRKGDPLSEAMHDFMEENHASVELDKQARELVREQERRGRG